MNPFSCLTLPATTTKCIQRMALSSKKSTIERYLRRQAKDVYCAEAHIHSYRARSAFKLLQLNQRFKILRPGEVVLDVGASPGSWCQVAAEILFPQEVMKMFPIERPEGYILGVDLQGIEPMESVDLLPGADITKPATQREINRRLNGRLVDVVLSDMAPNPTGSYYNDHLRIISLCRCLLDLLRAGGSDESSHFDDTSIRVAPNARFLCKIWDGTEREKFRAELERKFQLVKICKPDASRDESSEIYFFAKDFKRPLHTEGGWEP